MIVHSGDLKRMFSPKRPPNLKKKSAHDLAVVRSLFCLFRSHLSAYFDVPHRQQSARALVMTEQVFSLQQTFLTLVIYTVCQR